MGNGVPSRHLWAVGSGWEGPFQLEVVLVAAEDRGDAMDRAEAAFARARQPVCRAKMRLRDLGPLDADLLVGPLTGATSVLDAADASGRRCGPSGDSVAPSSGDLWPPGQ